MHDNVCMRQPVEARLLWGMTNKLSSRGFKILSADDL